MAPIKRKDSIASINLSKWVQNISKGKQGDFEVIELDLKPHLAALLSSGKGGHRATPLKRSGNPCSCLCWNQEGM